MAPNISYLNENEIEYYYKLYDIKSHIRNSSKLVIEASPFEGPKVGLEIEKREDNFDIVDKLNALWDYLNKNELVSYERPITTDEADFTGDFIFEKVAAHKLYFPKSKLNEINGLNHLAVWVVEPDPDTLSEEPWEFTGTFLFLIETLYDRDRFAKTLSGCCSLQALANIVHGKQFYQLGPSEPLGRFNPQHPLEKLKDIGAIYLQKQEIKTLYRKRYITNEQSFPYNGKNYRCNDLLGYPLFIS